MNATLRERLVALWNQFSESRKRFFGLKLDLLMQLTGEPMSRKRWQAFLDAKVEGALPDVIWDPFPNGQFLGRFSENLRGLQEFEATAKNAYLLLCEMDPALDGKDGYYGWLRTIHDIARDCPTKSVHYDIRLWGYEDPPEEDVFADLTDRRFTHRGMSLPSYPVQLSFRCLFNVSMAAIELFLAPYRARFLMDDRPIRLVPWQLFAVSANSALLGHTPSDIAKTDIRDAVMRVCWSFDRLLKPRFIEGPNGGGELMIGGQTVRKVYPQAKFAIPILRKFESQDWPPWVDIDDPGLAHQVRDFPTQMNGHQVGRRQIRFSAPKSGMRIAWRVVDVVAPRKHKRRSGQSDS